MKNIYLLLISFLITFSVQSQRNPENTYLTSFTYKAKDGMTAKFEKAASKKTKMFNSEDGNIILTYKAITGPDTGVYERYLVNQKSSSYDRDASKELQYWDDNVAPYVGQAGGQQRWLHEDWAAIGEGGDPKKYLHKTIVRYKPGMREHAARYIYRAGKVAEKRNPNTLRRVFSIVSGGDLNMIVIFNGFDKYDDWVENDSTWAEDYNEMFGWETHSDDLEHMQKSLRDWNGMVRYTLERVDF